MQLTFNETNGITNVTTTIKFASQADRDAAMSTGMTDGMEMSYKQLDGVLAALSEKGTGPLPIT